MTGGRFQSFAASLLLTLVLSAPWSGAFAQTHTLNLNDVDINVLISTVSEITGRNFVVDPRVTGNVRVVSAQPMTADQIYEVFLSVLRVHGFAAIPGDRITRIVPDANARQDTIVTASDAAADDLVTRTIPVDNVSAAELVPILKQLLPQQSLVVAHDGSNLLIVSDRAGNVERLRKIVQRLDRATDAEIEVVPLQHASATEVVRVINALTPKSGNGGAPKAIADERTNSILLGGERTARLRLRAIITNMDTPLEDDSSTEVVNLRYANAESLVPILENVSKSLRGAGTDEEEVAGGMGTTIQAHPQTNALIISASPAVYRSLSSIIRQLDVRRAQVLVEAIIAEISEDALRELGVQWQLTDNLEDGDGVIGGTNFGPRNQNILTLLTDPTALGGLNPGLNVGVLDGTFSIPGIDGDRFRIGALVSALRQNSDTNVLSHPQIVTMDHEEAVIQIGQEVPFLTGSFTNTGTANSSLNPFQTIDRETVGITLTVTPHINEGDSILLDINQEVSSLSPAAVAVDLITNKRTISTSVLVPDGGMLILGGLIDESLQDLEQRVPGLGQIPLLGNLFKYRSSNKVRRNLMVFIRPQILMDRALQDSITNSKYQYIRGRQQLERQTNESLTPTEELPLLPEMYEFLQRPETGPEGR